MPSKEVLREALVSRRVRLVQVSDPYTALRPGDEGTVVTVDDASIVHVDWDSGSTLGMIHGEDLFEVVR